MVSKITIAQELATSTEREARAACARFPWISDDLMRLLSDDKHSIVRAALASNPSASLEILHRLKDDVAPHVREAAQRNISRQAVGNYVDIESASSSDGEPWIPAGMTEEQAEMLRLTLTGDLSDQLAERLLKLGNEWVRAYLAFPNFAFWGKVKEPSHFTFGPSILDRLLLDESGLVRAALARNPNIPERFYELLATDADRRVQEMLCLNPKTPMAILESLAATGNWRLLECITNNDSVPLG